jgi:TPR repeat protein
MGTRLSPANETKALYYLNLAAEARNPAGAGLQGYVLLLQLLRATQDEIDRHDGDVTVGQRFTQSDVVEAKVAKLLKLLRAASKKGDVNGVLGLGLAYFHGVGVSANLTKAVEHLQRAVGVHIDAGYYLGEICMGTPSLELSSTSQFSRTRHATTIATDGVSKGRNKMENRLIESHLIGHAVSQKAIDPAAAARAYSTSAQMGHVLAQHR